MILYFVIKQSSIEWRGKRQPLAALVSGNAI
jgi:hypothetical protein